MFDLKIDKLSSLSDEGLMNKLQMERDRASFDALVGRFKKPLFSYIYRYVNQAEVAEDLLQDVFIRLWTKNEQWNGAKGSVKNWLFQIAVNLCRDYWRQAKNNVVTLGDDVLSTLEDDDNKGLDKKAMNKQAGGYVAKVVKELPQEQREILLLSYYHEFSHKEIGKILDLTAKAVERRLAKIRDDLKISLINEGFKTAQDGGF